MFLDVLKRRNPDFIKAATVLHREGKIPSNCYLLDLDTMERNAEIIIEGANSLGMKTFGMTKQIGRQPSAIKALIRAGIDRYVAVDIQCAKAVTAGGGKLGHVGHLVQIAKGDIPWVVEHNPDYWTVFSLQQADAISRRLPRGSDQKVLARIQGEGDTFYRGHEGGFESSGISETARRLNAFRGIEFAGITSFPCLLFDSEKQGVYPTPNLNTLKKASAVLKEAGWDDLEVNTPGTTSSKVLPLLAESGATQVEPGHGLTGTTPLHAVTDLPEKPTVLYVSEISHSHKDQYYCFGGGLYIDPVFPPYNMNCLTGPDPESILSRRSPIELSADNAIDYYGMLHPEVSMGIQGGDTVIMGFRPQIFVTRSYVAGVSGVRGGSPRVESMSYANGGRV